MYMCTATVLYLYIQYTSQNFKSCHQAASGGWQFQTLQLVPVAGQQFRDMIECIATDIATMMVNVTDLQFQAEHASGERLNSNHSAATGVKAALHKLVKKYAGDQTAERLLGAPAKPRRMSGATIDRKSRSVFLKQTPCCAGVRSWQAE